MVVTKIHRLPSRYGTVHVQFYVTSQCMYPSRDEDYDFCEIFSFVTIVSSLQYCPRLTAVVSRCSHPAHVYHRCPTLQPTALLAPTHHPIFFSYLLVAQNFLYNVAPPSHLAARCLQENTHHNIQGDINFDQKNTEELDWNGRIRNRET